MVDLMNLDLPLVPHGNHLLTAPVEEHESALVLPASYLKAMPTRRSVVLAVGEGLARDDGVVPEPPCRVGDLILHRRHAGTDLEIAGQRVTVMEFGDVYVRLID